MNEHNILISLLKDTLFETKVLIEYFTGYSMTALFFFGVGIWILFVVVQVLKMIWHLSHEWWVPKPIPVFPIAVPNGKRVLVVGDSTAYGTGASSPEDTLAGRLHKDFPRVEVVNNAVNGSLTADVLRQLEGTTHPTYNIIFISTGGNDIWHFTSLKNIRKDLINALTKAKAMSEHRVIVLFYSNFASAPLFPSLILKTLRLRTEKVHRVFLEVCELFQVPCIELFTEFATDEESGKIFAKDPARFFAKDYMHPSSEGYRLWYNRLWSEMVRGGYSSRLE